LGPTNASFIDVGQFLFVNFFLIRHKAVR